MTKNSPAVQVGDMEKDEKLEWAAIKEGQSLFQSTSKQRAFKQAKREYSWLHPRPRAVIVREARYGPTVQLGSRGWQQTKICGPT